MLGRGPMGRPSLLCGSGNPDADAERRLLAELLLEYVDRLQGARYSDSLCVARVKQWLSLGSKVNPDIRPLFEPVKRLLAVSEVRTTLARALA